MKRKIVILVFLIITSQLVFGQSKQAKNVNAKKIEQEVKQAMKELGDALSTGDMEKTKSLIADVYFTQMYKLKYRIKIPG